MASLSSNSTRADAPLPSQEIFTGELKLGSHIKIKFSQWPFLISDLSYSV